MGQVDKVGVMSRASSTILHSPQRHASRQSTWLTEGPVGTSGQ